MSQQGNEGQRTYSPAPFVINKTTIHDLTCQSQLKAITIHAKWTKHQGPCTNTEIGRVLDDRIVYLYPH